MDHLLLFFPHIFPKVFLHLESLFSLLHPEPLKELVTTKHVSLYGLVFRLDQIMIYLHLFELAAVWIMHKVKPVGPWSFKSASHYLVSLLVFKDHMDVFFLLPVFHLLVNHFRRPDQIVIDLQVSLRHFVIVRSYKSFTSFSLSSCCPDRGMTA